MFVAFWDQVLGNSTSRCSKAFPPSLKLGMTASRVSHSMSSKGCRPSAEKYRLNVSPWRMTCTSPSFVVTPTPPFLPSPRKLQPCNYELGDDGPDAALRQDAVGLFLDN